LGQIALICRYIVLPVYCPEACGAFSPMAWKRTYSRSMYRVNPWGRVAVKRASGLHAADILLEVAMLRLCSHRNVLTLFGYCDDARAPCMITPLMRGGSLDGLTRSAYSTCRAPSVPIWSRCPPHPSRTTNPPGYLLERPMSLLTPLCLSLAARYLEKKTRRFSDFFCAPPPSCFPGFTRG